MVYERPESAQDNFGKFIYQFQPETKTLIRKLERVLELYRQNVSLLFNQTCLCVYIYIKKQALYGNIQVVRVLSVKEA